MQRHPGGEEEAHHRHGPRRVPRPLERDGEQEEVEKVNTSPRQSQAERYRGEDDRGLVVQVESRPLHRRQLGDRHQDVAGIPSLPTPPRDHVERREKPAVSVRVQSAEDETRDARNQGGDDPRPEPCPLELLPPGRPDEGVGEERTVQAERHQVRRVAVRPHEDHRGEKVDQFLAAAEVILAQEEDRHGGEQVREDLRPGLDPDPKESREREDGKDREEGVRSAKHHGPVKEKEDPEDHRPDEERDPVLPRRGVHQVKHRLEPPLAAAAVLHPEGGIVPMLAGGDIELLDDVLSQRDVRPEVAREDLREHRQRDEKEKGEGDDVQFLRGEIPPAARRVPGGEASVPPSTSYLRTASSPP